MAEIRLVRGEIALVDEEHRERLAQYSWYLSNTGYVVAHIPGRLLSMHRVVLGSADDEIIDHRNCNKLDNRVENLRSCTHAENMRNRKMHKNNKCGAKGVYADLSRKTPRYRAQIRVDGKAIRLGSFSTIEAAQVAYANAAAEYHGEFARA